MIKLTTASLVFLAAGIFTSVSILSGFQILFGISLIYLTFISISSKKVDLPRSAWWLMAFTLIGFLSLLINFEYLKDPSKSFGRLKYFIFAIGGIFVFRFWLKETSEKSKRFIFNVFLISVVVAGIVAIWQVTNGRPRAKALTETMRYGYGSAIALLGILSAILHRKKLAWLDLRFAVPALLLGFVGMYLTYTRGALLGFLCGVPFAMYYFRPKFMYYSAAIAILIVSTLVGFNQFGSGQYNSRFLKSKTDSSDGIRRSIWQAAIIATKERPVLGWGLSNFYSQLKRIKEENKLPYPEYNDAHAHNLYLDILAGTGILGLIAFVGWLISWALECFRAQSMVRAFVIPMGASFTISSVFEMTLSANIACMLFAIYSISVSGISVEKPYHQEVN